MSERRPLLPLYDVPDFYQVAFGEPGEEEAEFFALLLGPPGEGRVLSLGCGEGRLEAPLAARGYRLLGLDAAPAMVARAARRDPSGHYLAARMEAPPFAVEGLAGAFSALLSFAYLVDPVHRAATLQWVAAALRPGAPLVLEVPLAWRPRRLQGIRETHQFPGGAYSFDYFDVLAEDNAGAVLATRLRVETAEGAAEREAPLTVFTPGGMRLLLEGHGFGGVLFLAPHDLESGTESPPGDCLRGVVAARLTRPSGGG